MPFTKDGTRLRTVVDTAIDGFILIDAQGTILTFNPACEKLFGYAAQEVIGENVKCLMPAPYQEAHDGYLDNYRRTGTRKIIGIGRQVVGKRKDGSTFPMDLSVGETKEDGKTIFVGVIHDLTKRIASGRALREAARRLRTLADTAVDGMVLIDAKGSILMFNRACERLFGYRAEEVMGKNVKCLMPSPYHEKHDSYLDNYKRTGIPKIIGIGREVVGRRKDGTTFPMDLSVGETTENGKVVFVGIIHDLIERARSEAALREAASRLTTVADTVIDGLVLIDAAGFILMFSRSSERLFGYRAAEVIGKNVSCLMPEPYRSAHDTYLDNYRDTGTRKIIGIGREVVGRRKDVSTFPMGLSVGETKEEGRTIFVGLIHDLTDRRKAETELLTKVEELERMNVELGHFAHIASHDLQEPLRIVSSYTQLLSQRYKGKLDPEADEFIAFAVGGAVRMKRVIEDLLQYARIETTIGAMPIVSSNQALDDALFKLGAIIDTNGVVVTRDPLPDAHADYAQLVELFCQLIENAIKFRRGTPPAIHVAATNDGGRWVFTVRDNGLGVDRRYFERIFEMFERLEGHDEDGSTGIGLAICKKIAVRHGGILSVESELKKGSTFSFSLAAA